MFSQCRSSLPILSGLALALCGATVQAAVVSYVGTQGPKPNLNIASPPVLEASILTAQTSFTQNVAELGRNDFETPPGLDFSYTGGSAMFSGVATRVQGSSATPGLGRYNTTRGLPDVNGRPNPGNWAASNGDFGVSFTGAITAFSFFVTDLGDYDGVVWLDIYGGSDGRLLNSQRLENNAGVTLDTNGVRNTVGANGNLLYFGVTSSTASEYFTSATFRIAQGGQNDFIGFDDFVVGQYIGPTAPPGIPEPGSLALTGLALFAAASAARGRKARKAA